MRTNVMYQQSCRCLLLALVSSAYAQLEEPDVPLFPLQEHADSTQPFPMPRCGSFQLEEATIDQIQAAMGNGTLTSVQLVTCYMMRTYQTEDYAK